MNVTFFSLFFLVVGFLGLVAIGVIVQVVLSSQKEKLTMKSMFQGVFTLILALPLVGVLAYFGTKVAPGFEPPEPPKLDDSSILVHNFDGETKDESASRRYGDRVAAWVKEDVRQTDEESLVVVSSSQHANLDDAREDVFKKAVKQIVAYYAVDKKYYGPIGITLKDVEKVREKEYTEIISYKTSENEFEMIRLHWQIALTPELRESLVSRAKESASKSRIWTLGSILATCTLLLFGFSSYLRLDTQTQGRYRNRLKFAAVSFMAVGCLVIAECFPLG